MKVAQSRIADFLSMNEIPKEMLLRDRQDDTTKKDDGFVVTMEAVSVSWGTHAGTGEKKKKEDIEEKEETEEKEEKPTTPTTPPTPPTTNNKQQTTTTLLLLFSSPLPHSPFDNVAPSNEKSNSSLHSGSSSGLCNDSKYGCASAAFTSILFAGLNCNI